MRIVCVHQGYELYGSDRAFADSVAALREAWPRADIEVVLPRHGPIVALLHDLATRIVFEPLFILRRRKLGRLVLTAPFLIVPALWRAARRMRAADLVYVNTIVVLDYLIVARFFRAKTLVHVHEIPDGLKLSLFRQLLAWTRAEVIFNSRATCAAYQLPALTSQHVVYNGIAAPERVQSRSYDGTRPLRVLMLGRINRIKGQDLLIEALARLPDDLGERIQVRIVGDSFQNDVARETALRVAISAARLDSIVRIEPFEADPSPLYRWADIVAVPSRLPESLGRVAIEAMAYQRPPLVARLGGLIEIVEDRVSGWIVPPNDADALARTLELIVRQPDTWRDYGAAARARFETIFAARGIARQFQMIVRARIGSGSDEREAPGLARV